MYIYICVVYIYICFVHFVSTPKFFYVSESSSRSLSLMLAKVTKLLKLLKS